MFKGLTEHDVLCWEEEKMRYQRKVGHKITDLDFLRHLLMKSSRPIITSKDGVAEGFLTGSRPIYDKTETLLERYRTKNLTEKIIKSDSGSEEPADVAN